MLGLQSGRPAQSGSRSTQAMLSVADSSRFRRVIAKTGKINRRAFASSMDSFYDT